MIETILTTAIILPILTDTIDTPSLYVDEVVIVSASSQGQRRSVKGSSATIDEHLATLPHVNLIRRGSYAWEPVVNNMTTERVSTTIDGMKIFYACTDKMDPVTSYVESSNLQSILLNSGLNGNPQSTGNIGGSLDLKLRKGIFAPSPLHAKATAGYETNGHVQAYALDVQKSSERLYAIIGTSYRHADNYKEGGGREVLFSQFGKVNAFANLGWKATDNDILETSFIYDRADDVGYPALNMDVAKAEAFIASASYRHLWHASFLNSWETKGYYNHITHVMDDTKRPDVEIHMDMPGESWTAGLYSLLTASTDRHQLQANYDLYYNRLFADMTMYPGGAAPMYMVTWPDVGTINTGLAFSDILTLSPLHRLYFSAKIALQHQRLNAREGYEALRVFFPGMKDSYHQTTGRISLRYIWTPRHWQVEAATGWGSRAPTVTEAYGYYLNNTFDQYDYIGNPRLKNESAIEANVKAQWSPSSSFSLIAEAGAFFFSNYIIGQFEDRLSPMTVDAEGVKVYYNIDHATIANATLSLSWHALPWLSLTSSLSHAVGRDDEGDNLPLIAPLAYRAAADFSLKGVKVQVEAKGNARQRHFAPKYGEKETSAYTIYNISSQYSFDINKTGLTLRAGIENVFDRSYSTYADWCGIPQKGRNTYVNLSVSL